MQETDATTKSRMSVNVAKNCLMNSQVKIEPKEKKWDGLGTSTGDKRNITEKWNGAIGTALEPLWDNNSYLGTEAKDTTTEATTEANITFPPNEFLIPPDTTGTLGITDNPNTSADFSEVSEDLGTTDNPITTDLSEISEIVSNAYDQALTMTEPTPNMENKPVTTEATIDADYHGTRRRLPTMMTVYY
ncbi:hypothetical protein OUZ56_010487 [Daphnia magna]|uniref:Uncharacterized protein n=1 Tax=Daphnia magna TaxID=35525 RepID=A0ABR0AIQ9_9CRUS|nr:hypothetical protein OUZ56_010487 [Daphnia magna]